MTGELLGDFGTEVAVGEYSFVWRVALEEGDAWTYCGVNGTFDTFAPADAGTLTVAAAGEPVTIAAWDFAGSSLTASEGVGSAQFIEGGVPTSCNFYGSDDEWTCDNFLMDTEFFQPDGVTPKSNVYFRYEADFTGYSDISASGLFKVSNSGPTHLQIAAEYGDGSLEFMAEPFEITARNTEFNATFVLPPAAGNSGPVAYRFYPYNPSSTGGNMRMITISFAGTAL
ncbi:hypothetical protein FRC98_05950 [Lujinxingia vulgaris]|uniref:Uncharacterized protein n=1 Tax=Lujinxingia vulgaris TaxID=2600176 RepID=A0A5C6XJX2_9DELT|nr:hypothetical protein [Lujinxingia vulgaris]TXD38430.1 hypothetical protein FRC98_05950 [Lujinxingia vulgaris]